MACVRARIYLLVFLFELKIQKLNLIPIGKTEQPNDGSKPDVIIVFKRSTTPLVLLVNKPHIEKRDEPCRNVDGYHELNFSFELKLYPH